MNIRHIVLAAATVAALSPALSNASPEKVSAKACANAFASSIAGPGATAPTYKFAYRGGFSSSSVGEFYQSDYTFTLEARDPKTGAPVARARCSTNSRGNVVTIAAVPLESPSLAAQF